MASFFTKKQRAYKNIVYYIVFLFLCFSDHYYSSAQTVPALYVFGDSLVDVGNNNHLPLSILKANFPYNGVDFPGKKPTGRFSNGKNAADFIAEKLGLTSPPPYLSQPNDAFLNGASFASGGAGILNGKDEGIIKQSIPLSHQVELFSTVRQRLVKDMGVASTDKHLSASIFPIVIGSNDIIQYFRSSKSNKSFPQQHVALMLSTLRDMIKVLHDLGARKLFFIGVPPIGCAPRQRIGNTTDECNIEVSYWSSKYNEGLTLMLRQLKLELNGFHYSYFDTYKVLLEFIHNPTTYGMKDIKSACCGFGKLRAELPCTPVALHCPNRNEHLFWDFYHPTENAARIFVNVLFSGSNDYSEPFSITQLVAI